jgi:hypothetical protein
MYRATSHEVFAIGCGCTPTEPQAKFHKLISFFQILFFYFIIKKFYCYGTTVIVIDCITDLNPLELIDST